ncbi:Ketoreductase azaE [Colletotrichum aenigma]|uniref:Ketoreductase azaE n=1 Tax=Colletotrichum aenigma TaxID=1215731 RepID=UPI0018733012|nr:Ketoreductase azaE [Colletotrichum aenigma]KAF5519554.1 Ketoreductase azaE [Colletotrichum aenigma]
MVVKFSRVSAWGADDLMILITFGFLIAFVPLNANAGRSGAGQDMWTLTVDQITEYFKNFYVIQALYYSTIAFLKASVLFMYLRIFPGKRFRTVLWGTQAFNLAIGVTFVLLGIFQCRPIHLAWTAWRGDSESRGTCMDVVITAMVYSAIQVGLDIWMLILPLTQILGLNMKWSKKFGLMFMFSLGLFLTAASTIRLKLLVDYHQGTHNFTVDSLQIDMTVDGAFDKATQAEPTLEAVIHTASPFHFQSKDAETEMLNPAIRGTTSLLSAVAVYAPNVKKVVITSSVAAAAAWDFVNKKPHFALSTILPPLILGPVVHHLDNLGSINTSNPAFVDIIEGKWEDSISATGSPQWVDVRDAAFAHVQALIMPEAVGKRFLLYAGDISNAAIASIAKDNFPELADKMPENIESDVAAADASVDAGLSKDILGVKYRSLNDSVFDSIRSLLGR